MTGSVPVLAADGVRVSYGGAEAVADVAIAAHAGSVTAIIGPNGAGKSSLLLGLIGAVSASARSITVGGRRIDGLDARARVHAGLVLVPQGRQIFPRLTVAENLRVVADGLRLSGDTVEQSLDRFPILRQRQALPAGNLSGGEQQMLALARALMTRPKVLLLDEPTLGLAPIIVAEVVRTIAGLAEDGIAVVLVEPSLRLVRSRIDRGYVMLRGRIASEVSSLEALERDYLRLMGLEHREAP